MINYVEITPPKTLLKGKYIIISSLILSIVFFALGMWFPLFTTKNEVLGFVVKFQEIRLMDSVVFFYEDGDYILSTIILLFTIILPVIKFIELFNRIFQFFTFSPKTKEVLGKIDKWSMLDVFLVALLLLNFKLNSNFIVTKLAVGTTFIALSIVVRMLTTTLIDFNHENK
ncbi:MAG: paraquat-inducible protein A [Flavobacteriaceae bacterium]|nr:paraquat-inducible protein A [Flavobacteriaceae bacterium]